MKEKELITRAQLSNILDSLRLVFDLVRIVDPLCTEVIKEDDEQSQDSNHKCYDIWKKNMRCRNCISLIAYADLERKTKYEFQEEYTWSVIAMPFIITDEENRVVVIEVANDISKEVVIQADGQNLVTKVIHEIDHKLYVDALTGVYNRRYFEEKQFLFATTDKLSKKIGFIMFDIHRFKQINDSYGHSVGDLVLKEVAQTMTKYIRKEDVCIRIGGDEYLIVIQNANEYEVIASMKRVKECMIEVDIAELKGLPVTVNAGYAYTENFYPDKQQIQQLFDEADIKMYEEKLRER